MSDRGCFPRALEAGPSPSARISAAIDVATYPSTAVSLDGVPPSTRVVDATGCLHVAPSCRSAHGVCTPFSFTAPAVATASCSTCRPLDDGPLAQALDFLTIARPICATPVSWTALARQRVFLADPFATFHSVMRPGWAGPLEPHLDEQFAETAARSAVVATTLDPTVVHVAMLAHDERVARLDRRWASTAAMLALYPPRRPRDRRLRRCLAAALGTEPVDVLVAANHPTLLPIGSSIDALVDLLAGHRFHQHHAVLRLPAAVADAVLTSTGRPRMSGGVAACLLPPAAEPFAPWATRLWLHRPSRPLAECLDLATRCARRPVNVRR